MTCRVCSENHPTYMCCDRCNYDTHDCPGCGEWVGHGRIVCDDCNEEQTMNEQQHKDPTEWDVFILGRISEWQRLGSLLPGLLEAVGMTRYEYSRWIMSGHVSDRFKRVWSR